MPKQYINGVFIREHKFNDGGSILKLSIPSDKIDALCEQIHAAADNGWTRLEVFRLREPKMKDGKVTVSHGLAVDEWKPGASAPRQSSGPANAPAEASEQTESDQVPF